MEEYLDVVDKDDQVIGRATREEVYKKNLLHRIVHIWVFNDAGKVALQLRSAAVSFAPLHWDFSGDGHVFSGESYEQAAKRELEEELGINPAIVPIYHELFQAQEKPRQLFMISGFTAQHNGPFQLNDEVERIEFKSLAEVSGMIQQGEKFHPQLPFFLNKYFNAQ